MSTLRYVIKRSLELLWKNLALTATPKYENYKKEIVELLKNKNEFFKRYIEVNGIEL